MDIKYCPFTTPYCAFFLYYICSIFYLFYFFWHVFVLYSGSALCSLLFLLWRSHPSNFDQSADHCLFQGNLKYYKGHNRKVSGLAKSGPHELLLFILANDILVMISLIIHEPIFFYIAPQKLQLPFIE